MQTGTQFCDDAFALLEAGDFDEAVGLAECGLRSYPDEGRLWELRGIAQGCRLCVREALGSLERASLLVPLSPFGQIALAGCYVQCNHLRSAGCIYAFLVTRDDLPPSLLADLAEGFDHAGQPEWALEVCRAAVRRVPDCHPALFAIAHYLSKLDHPADEIVPVLQRAFDLCPDEVLYRVDLALLLARCGQVHEAYLLLVDADLEELLKLHCPPRLNELTQVFRQQGDQMRARACEARLRQVGEAETRSVAGVFARPLAGHSHGDCRSCQSADRLGVCRT
jgi:tetratricopeptide (TPR) repeat protein